jgi:hypothetical protein
MTRRLRLAGAAAAALAVLTAASAAAAPGDPETTITSSPQEAVADGRATFTFTASGPVLRFECRVDEQPWRTCASPHTTAPQIQGDHVFGVRAVGAGGEPDPTPAEAPFAVDKSIAGANAAARHVVRVGDGPIALRVRVTAGEDATASAHGRIVARKRRIALPATAAIGIPAGAERTISLPVRGRDARRVRKALRKAGSARAVLRVTFTDSLGNSATTGVIGVTLKPAR